MFSFLSILRVLDAEELDAIRTNSQLYKIIFKFWLIYTDAWYTKFVAIFKHLFLGVKFLILGGRMGWIFSELVAQTGFSVMAEIMYWKEAEARD